MPTSSVSTADSDDIGAGQESVTAVHGLLRIVGAAP